MDSKLINVYYSIWPSLLVATGSLAWMLFLASFTLGTYITLVSWWDNMGAFLADCIWSSRSCGMHSSCMPRLSLCLKASISGKNMILFVEVLSHDEFSRSHQFWVSYPMFAIFPEFRATPCY